MRVAPFHELTMESISGEDVSLADYEGTVCLVVNLATY
jgi:glutathione peroxidase-family protein